MSDGDITLYPAWKQAVEDFMSAGFKPGDLIPHAWLAEHFGLPMLDDAATLTLSEYRDRQFVWLAHVEAVKSELLEQHQIFLKSVFGEGYRWVPPNEQTSIAVNTFEREAKRAYRKAGMRLTHVRVAELTDAQRQENLDAIGRLSMLQGMHKQLE
jgi:hypothetical protein